MQTRRPEQETLQPICTVWILMNALDRKHRKAVKKPRILGVTPQMLVWMGKNILDRFERGQPTAWFFMLRAKEFQWG